MAMVSNRYEQVNLPMIIDLKHDHNIIPEEGEEDEEEEEEIINDYENLVNEEYNEEEEEDEEEDEDENYYLEENTRGYMDEYDTTTTAINDDPFYLANRTFYTTCHKISRQNSPSYRKRPPYTFLENWLIHSVFSKSQQILLRFPVIHPKVMMTEGDFIYTPHQMANENQQDIEQQQQQQQQQQQEEEDYDYYDDAFVIGDEGVLVMSASAPDASQFMAQDDDDEDEDEGMNKRKSEKMNSIVMDENMWMGHSRYNTNGLTLHVVNPDEEEEEDEQDEDDPMYHSVISSNNPYKSIISHNSYQGKPLQMVKEEDEEEEEEDISESESESQQSESQSESDIEAEEETNLNNKLSISPQVLSWYRSAETTNTKSIFEDKSLNEESSKNVINSGCSTSSNSSTASTCSNNSTSHHQQQQRTDFIRTTNTTTDEVEKTMTRRSSESYQSLADIMEEEQQLRDYGTLPTYHNRSIMTSKKKVSTLMQVSVCFVDAAWVAMDIAQSYADSNQENKTVTTFVHSLFKIWKTLFLGAETMLGWGNHRLKPQTMV